MNIYLDLEEDSKIKRSAKILLLEYTRRVLSVYFSPSSKYLCHTDLFLFLEVLSNQKYIRGKRIRELPPNYLRGVKLTSKILIQIIKQWYTVHHEYWQCSVSKILTKVLS
jgi:hypothetical protein